MFPTISLFYCAGLYCSGWVKTGPVGVIVTTMENAFETAATILEDYENGEPACVHIARMVSLCVCTLLEW